MGRTVVLPLLALLCGRLYAGGVQDVGAATFLGRIEEPKDLSAVVTLEGLLLIASDEGDGIQVLERVSETRTWRVKGDPLRPLPSGGEIDFEGLARQGNRVFALGSHSLVRDLPKPDKSQTVNRRRLATVDAESARDHLFRLTLDPATGKLAAPVESINLRPLLTRDAITGPFTRIPGKENGVDIEGIAVNGDRLLLGFRSPVLRSGHVPVMVLTFERPERYELLFVDAGGRGIRDLVRVEKGFLVLVGPERAEAGGFEVYAWDGLDRVPGADQSSRGWRSLGTIPAPPGAQVEGLAVLEEGPTEYEVLVVYDGAANGAPRLFRLSKTGHETRSSLPAPRPG